MATILIVDSNGAARRQLLSRLRDAGHTVDDCPDAQTALQAMFRLRPDLVLTDFKLIDRNALDLLQDIRRDDTLKSSRVLMMAGGADAAKALAAGADDCIHKPVDADELRARVDACLKRSPVLLQSESISSGGITIDNISKRLLVDGRYLAIAPREYHLLLFFLRHPDRVFTREQLLARVWGHDVSVGARTVDVHVRRLRGLLESAGYDRQLQTVRGSGYRYSLTV